MIHFTAAAVGSTASDTPQTFGMLHSLLDVQHSPAEPNH
jgi:hypothetical protein